MIPQQIRVNCREGQITNSHHAPLPRVGHKKMWCSATASRRAGRGSPPPLPSPPAANATSCFSPPCQNSLTCGVPAGPMWDSFAVRPLPLHFWRRPSVGSLRPRGQEESLWPHLGRGWGWGARLLLPPKPSGGPGVGYITTGGAPDACDILLVEAGGAQQVSLGISCALR